ncbi:MAG: hypothetical protein ACE5GN_01195 [Waddliaceae bacterium]
MTSILIDIQKALNNHCSFEISRGGEKEPFLKIRSFWNRIFHWGDTNYHTERIERIAKVLARSLGEMPRLTLEEANKDPTLKTARTFLRRLKPNYRYNPKVRECCRQLLAAKLGIDVKLFAANDGFESFAFESHLEKYLLDYEHTLKVQGSDAVHILYEGKYTPWSEVRQKLRGLPTPTPNFQDNPKEPWLYGQQGVQKKDMYAWTEFKPYKTVKNHDWGDRYIFEFCTSYGNSVQLNGDHAWLRLKTPTGEIYCVGLYRPGKRHCSENFLFPMRVKKGYFMSPDFSEYWPMPVSRIPVEITKEQFEKIKGSIEEDKRNENKRSFQVFKGNCTEYVNDKAALIGIKLPTATHALRHVMPMFITKTTDRVMPCLPRIVQKICRIVVTFLTNLLQFSLGASRIDKLVKRKKIKVKTHLSSVRDLFNPEKLKFHPPRHLAVDVYKKLERWRKKEMEKIARGKPVSEQSEEIKAKIEKIRFALPEKYRTK